MLDDPVVVEIARAVGKTPAQVVLRWHLRLDRGEKGRIGPDPDTFDDIP